MGRHTSRRLSDEKTVIFGDFSHTNDGGMVNDLVLLGAKFTTWARENCNATDAEALCGLCHYESLSLTENIKANYGKLQKSCFEKIKASGLQIPIFTTT